ncbi:MAG: hypothetical protein QHC90_14750 [Shinella sp.]|nr:hypothetical protein [Shinella sp.]
MTDIQSPKAEITDPDRLQECEGALAIAFHELVSRAVAAGWREGEVATALAIIAENHIVSLSSPRGRRLH